MAECHLYISVTKRQDIVITESTIFFHELFFHEITDFWAKSLTVYLICDNGEHKARKDYRITQIKARITVSLGNQLTRFRISYHTKFNVSAALHCGRQRVFKHLKDATVN